MVKGFGHFRMSNMKVIGSMEKGMVQEFLQILMDKCIVESMKKEQKFPSNDINGIGFKSYNQSKGLFVASKSAVVFNLGEVF